MGEMIPGDRSHVSGAVESQLAALGWCVTFAFDHFDEFYSYVYRDHPGDPALTKEDEAALIFRAWSFIRTVRAGISHETN